MPCRAVLCSGSLSAAAWAAAGLCRLGLCPGGVVPCGHMGLGSDRHGRLGVPVLTLAVHGWPVLPGPPGVPCGADAPGPAWGRSLLLLSSVGRAGGRSGAPAVSSSQAMAHEGVQETRQFSLQDRRSGSCRALGAALWAQAVPVCAAGGTEGM